MATKLIFNLFSGTKAWLWLSILLLIPVAKNVNSAIYLEVCIMKFDMKSVAVGLLMGICITLAIGARAGGGWGGQIGFAVPAGSIPIVRGTAGEAYMIDMTTLMAHRILFKEPVPADSRFPNVQNGRALTLGD